MAKKKEKIKKKLLPYKEITVKSLAYGVHTRAARGSKTPVAINDVLKENVAKTAIINSTAKRVHDLLKHCGQGFKEAMLWQVMLSRMRKAASMNMLDLLLTLKGMELNSKYPLKRFANVPFVKVQSKKNELTVSLINSMPLYLKDNATQYSYELFLLTLGKDAKHDGMMSASSAWMEKDDAMGEVSFDFVLTSKLAFYVVCLHIMTGKNGKATGTLASRGMQIVGVGKV